LHTRTKGTKKGGKPHSVGVNRLHSEKNEEGGENQRGKFKDVKTKLSNYFSDPWQKKEAQRQGGTPGLQTGGGKIRTVMEMDL